MTTRSPLGSGLRSGFTTEICIGSNPSLAQFSPAPRAASSLAHCLAFFPSSSHSFPRFPPFRSHFPSPNRPRVPAPRPAKPSPSPQSTMTIPPRLPSCQDATQLQHISNTAAPAPPTPSSIFFLFSSCFVRVLPSLTHPVSFPSLLFLISRLVLFPSASCLLLLFCIMVSHSCRVPISQSRTVWCLTWRDETTLPPVTPSPLRPLHPHRRSLPFPLPSPHPLSPITPGQGPEILTSAPVRGTPMARLPRSLQ
jgi:hypothetical protein